MQEQSHLAKWIESRPAAVECLQVVATQGSGPRFRLLSQSWPLILKDPGLSIGSPGALDRDYLNWLLPLVKESSPVWITTPFGFSQTSEVQLGFPNPICPNLENLSLLGDRVAEVAGMTGLPVLLENIASALQFEGGLPETEFIGRLCSLPGCGLALNLGSLYANSRNHVFDPIEWVKDLDPGTVFQISLSGYKQVEGHYEDSSSAPIAKEIWQLADEAFDHVLPKALILLKDSDLEDELEMARTLLKRAR